MVDNGFFSKMISILFRNRGVTSQSLCPYMGVEKGGKGEGFIILTKIKRHYVVGL